MYYMSFILFLCLCVFTWELLLGAGLFAKLFLWEAISKPAKVCRATILMVFFMQGLFIVSLLPFLVLFLLVAGFLKFAYCFSFPSGVFFSCMSISEANPILWGLVGMYFFLVFNVFFIYFLVKHFRNISHV